MTRKTKIRLWIGTIVIGILMIPAGVGWIIYTVTQTGHYDPNAEFTDRTPTSLRTADTPAARRCPSWGSR
jgi:hypothetical protein